MDIKLILVAMLALWAGSQPAHSADPEAIAAATALPRELLKNMLASERARRALFSRLTGLAATAVGSSSGSGGAGSALMDASSAVGELLKPQPYQLSSMEMHTIKAIGSIQHLIGDIFSRFGISLPSIMKLINRRGLDTSSLGAPASKSSNLGLLVRGLALSLPLIIPAVNQIRRQSHDSPLQQFAPIPMASEQVSSQYSPEQYNQQYYQQSAASPSQSMADALQYHQHSQQHNQYQSQPAYYDQQESSVMQRRSSRGKRSVSAFEPAQLTAMQRQLVQTLLQDRRILEQLRLFAQKFEQ